MSNDHAVIYLLILLGMLVGAGTIIVSIALWRIVSSLRDMLGLEMEQVSGFINALDPESIHELVGVHTRRLENHEMRLTELEHWRQSFAEAED
jgi:hypothetical protein